MAKILVIDDDPKIVQVLRIRLLSAGYEVLTAADGVSGLRLALEGKPDLVIVDIWMPVGGGFSVAHRLREQAPEVPFIFITASKQAGLRQMADSLGAAGFLEKPYEKEDLLAAAAKALSIKPASPAGRPDTSQPQVTASAMATAASKQQGLRENAQQLGAVGFLEKPHEAADLLKTVAEALAATPSPVGDPPIPNVPKSSKNWDVSPTPSPVTDPPKHPETEFPAPAPPAPAPPAPEPLKVEPPAPTTPENAPDLRLANLRLAAPAGYAPKNQPELVGITGRNRILIVEDDRRIAMALALRLQNAGQEVIQAFDAMSGVEAAIQHQPDLILMDITLPGGSGLIVAQRIQSVVPKPTPIIFLTASRQPGLRQKALALGAAGFLEKPYDPENLLTTIQNALLAAVDKAPSSRTPAPATPENALDLRLANLKMAAPSSNAPQSQPKLVRIIGRNKILVVGNDRRIAMDLIQPLQNAGQEVIQASDATTGMAAATQHQPDLIVIDINLPGGSGLIMAQRIQSALPKLTPIIFLTARQQPELRQKALALGAAGFLEKSCNPEVLLTTIQNALSLGRGDDPTTHSGFFL
jgi:DNA-binding response OmpR family regulator